MTSRMGGSAKDGKKRPGQNTRKPTGKRIGRPSNAEQEELERKKKNAEKMRRSRERKRERAEAEARGEAGGPAESQPLPDKSVLGAKSTSNKKIKKMVDLAEELAGGDREKYAAVVDGLVKHPRSGDYRSRIQGPWSKEADTAMAIVQDMAG